MQSAARETVKVFARVRPLLEREKDQAVCVEVLDDNRTLRVKKSLHMTEMRFDRAFSGDSSQQLIYDNVKPSIHAALRGLNTTIFACML